MEDISKGSVKGRSQVPDSRPPPMFIADALGLDFLNSIGTPVDTVVEWLADGEDLLGWLQQANLIDSADAAAIRANSFPGELDEVAAQARALREWFREFVLSHMGRPLAAKALDLLGPLNRLLERDEKYGTIVARPARRDDNPRTSRLQWRALRRWSTPNSLLLPLAEAMADLVCSEDFSLVKGCEGKICTLLFLDKTHARGRRWCSMAICGNREKQASYRNRSKRPSGNREKPAAHRTRSQNSKRSK
jgi:predicted RNA-binding Zn ribbon-like protein